MGLNDDTLIALGLILKPRGLRGELLVKPYQAAGRSLHSGLPVVVKAADQTLQTEIQYVKNAGQRFSVKFAFVNDRSQAALYNGGEFYCKRDLLAKPDSGEYYIFELVGLKAVDANQVEIGMVTEIMNLPANDVLEINTPKGHILVPFIKNYIKEISMEKRQIMIDRIQEFIPDEN